MKTLNCLALSILSVTLNNPALAADEAAAMQLLKDSKCIKCHAVDKKKDGPSYKEVAAKFKGRADAEAELTRHVTVKSKVKYDGLEEDHDVVKTRDSAKIKNLVDWILSL
jgi:cytochrome c